MNELRECPYCGGEAHIAERITYGGKMYGVSCSTPLCPGSEPWPWCMDAEYAIRAWNTRPDTTSNRLDDRLISPIASPTVDRDALLKLADEMYRDGRIQLKRQRAGERQFIDGLDVMEYAQRMRKALGVADADE